MVVLSSFLEDQSRAVSVWRERGHKPSVLGGVGSELQLFSEDLELMDSKNIGDDSKINRLVVMSNHSSVFFSTQSKKLFGFASLSGSTIGQIDSSNARLEKDSSPVVDSDIHRSGHLASILDSSSLALIDLQRDSLVGTVPQGKTGVPSGTRIVDASTIAVASSIVSLYDVRTSESKSGIANFVLQGGSPGRTFTAIESDGSNNVIAGDSSGGLFLWDTRQPTCVLKNVHAHSGAVLSLAVGGGTVCSGSADGSVSLWTVVPVEQISSRKKTRTILSLNNFTADSGDLRRVAVSGTPTALAIESSSLGDSQVVVYATDTGVLSVRSVAEWSV